MQAYGQESVLDWTGPLLAGALVTLEIAVAAYAIGLLLGLLGATAKLCDWRPLRGAAIGYSTLVRAIPELLLIILLYYAGTQALNNLLQWLGMTGQVEISGFVAAIGVLAFVQGAYMTEVLRGAMLSVPKGELEAARAFGMSRFRILYRIWLPHAIQICLPTLAGELILLLTSVPLVSTIAVMDLLKAANIVRDETFLVYEPLLLIAGIYVALTLLLTIDMCGVERNFPGVRPATGTATADSQ